MTDDEAETLAEAFGEEEVAKARDRARDRARRSEEKRVERLAQMINNLET